MKQFSIRGYDLAATLDSGQAFRWERQGESWCGVIGKNWVRLQAGENFITAETAAPVADWRWLEEYLQLELDLAIVLATFPQDEPMQSALRACRGLRLLRQPPWETLASFILSSTKQIVQIRQIIAQLCERFGEEVSVPEGLACTRAFPAPERLAEATEAELRDCKMGFRAPYLLAAARAVAAGRLKLERLGELTLPEAREQLTALPGVGPKIADCVLLFAYNFPGAFPVDVWVMKALRELYFPRRQPGRARLEKFINRHFGVHAGYAQQYLFHYMRTRKLTPQNPSHLS